MNTAEEQKKGKKAKKAKTPSKADAQRALREKAAGKPAKEKGEKRDKVVTMKGKFDVLPPLTEEKKQEIAIKDDREFREIEHEVRTRGVRAMVILREMKGYELWKYLKSEKTGKEYKGFDQWLREAAPVSRAGGYAQLRVAEKLLPFMPKEELEEMPDYARKLLAKVPKIKLEKGSPIRQAAKTAKSPKELVDVIQKHAPEAHIEQKRKITVTGSAAGVINDAFLAAAVIAEVPEDEVLEFICADWMDSPCTREDCAGMSNREAWHTLNQRSAATQAEESSEEKAG